jgi:hypothetical protein
LARRRRIGERLDPGMRKLRVVLEAGQQVAGPYQERVRIKVL